jgi:hypothetical protein
MNDDDPRSDDIISVQDMEEPVPNEALISGIGSALFLVFLFAFVLGAMWCSDMIVAEIKRLEPWQAFLVFSSDLAALYWFGHFLFTRFVTEKPVGLKDRLVIQRHAKREACWVMASMVMALAIDGTFSVIVTEEEERAFANGQQTLASVGLVGHYYAGFADFYHISYTFAANGDFFHANAFIRKESSEGFPQGFDRGTVKKIETGKLESIQVVYDPDRPDRNWLKELGPSWEIYSYSFRGLSIAILVAEAVVFPFFFLLVWRVYRMGRIPWWHDLYKALPFFVEASFLFAAAIMLMPW